MYNVFTYLHCYWVSIPRLVARYYYLYPRHLLHTELLALL